MLFDNNVFFSVCAAETGDAEEISDLIKYCVTHTHGRYYTPEEISIWTEAYSKISVEECIAYKALMVFKGDEKILGTIQYDACDNMIKMLYVHPYFQNMGIGGILLQFMLGTIKQSGIPEVNLSSNRIFMNWYIQKFSFEVVQKEVVIWGGLEFEEFLMRRTFPGNKRSAPNLPNGFRLKSWPSL
ncbi:MAG: GNAT family N-acetyltransferase [Lewinellaceae bacterium]|nr:GNAT family N-acetyltransferase [Saprospiraceae bacterium]MCB9338461.1 GNAT family N-acetyltransferase [Lewinellaceae bacterium]